MISEEKFIACAKRLNCEVAVVKAVAEIESSGGGFITPTQVKLLFEPHIFWKELRKLGITPIQSDICYPIQGSKPYGKVSDQLGRLQRAMLINKEAALKSASYGLFQIMGFNYKLCGETSVEEFYRKMNISEENHLDFFISFIESVKLDDELRLKDWRGFARQYNGSTYWKNNYDKKLEKAYLKHKK
jgi:hypothetical protein